MFDHITNWFEQAIAMTDSIDQLKPGTSVSLEAQIIAAQILKKQLIDMRSNLEVMRQNHLG
jgi:hypothetical protein